MATVFLNGRFVTEGEAKVSAFDAGVQHGVGLFETMSARLTGGRAEVFRLEEHLARLIGSARELGLTDALRPGALAEAVALTVEKSGLARSRVRLTITGGDLSLLGARRAGGGNGEAAATKATPSSRVDPTVMIVAQPPTEYPPEMFQRGVTALIADLRVNPLDPMGGHKTLAYWPRLRELRRAAAAMAGESIVFQITNHLAGGCVSNVFLVKGGRLLTPIARGEEEGTEARRHGTKGPTMPSPVLPGITRGVVLEWAERKRIGVDRRMLTIDDLLGADEVFLTNASFGVLPVVRVEKHVIGAGAVGPLTRDTRRAWAELAGFPGET